MKVSRIIPIAIALLLIAVIMVPVAYGMGAIDLGEIDVNAPCSIKIHYEDKNAGYVIDDAIFSIYKVADIDEYGYVYVTDDFSMYNVNLLELDSDGLRDTAFTFEGLVDRDGLMPISSGVTDSKGNLTFPNNGNTMTAGIYLITGRLTFKGTKAYISDPILVSLPAVDKTTGRCDYNLQIVPKYDSFDLASEKEFIDCTVVKVWEEADEGAPAIPDEVSVVLLRDGEFYERVTLNKENNWRYTWEKLDAEHSWIAVEDDMLDYEVLVHREKNTIVITNTYVGPPPEPPTEPGTEPTTKPPKTTEPSTKPGTTEPGTTKPGTTNPGNEPTTTPGGNEPPEKLPQTGVLWWPVYACSFSGMLLFIIGWSISRKNEYTD